QPAGQVVPPALPAFLGGAPNTWIAIAACNQDLTQRALPVITKYTYTLWNADESSRTGTHECDDSYYEQYFSPTAITGPRTGGTSKLQFTISNPNPFAMTGATFTDAFPAGLTFVPPGTFSSTCAATILVSPGPPLTFTYTGNLPASATCILSVGVTAAVAGSY